ncbi:MAG: polysaccharide biosynthesis tyrosine autokinase [Rikenellaceae bacterium]
MKDIIDNDLRGAGGSEGGVDYKTMLFMVFRNWYWFLLSIIVMQCGAWAYLRYTVPTYVVTSSVMINDESSSTGVDLESLGLGSVSSKQNTLNSEIMVMRSKTMIESVVYELDLHTSYYVLGRINDIELYQSTPVTVSISSEDMAKLNGTIMISLQKSYDDGLDISYMVGEEEVTKHVTLLPATVETPMGNINLDFSEYASFEEWEDDSVIKAIIRNPKSVASEYRGTLAITSNTFTPGVVELSFVTTHRQRGVDFINTLVDVYNRKTKAAKNEIILNTSAFIADRLSMIDAELSSTEMEIELFKRQVGAVNIAGAAEYTYTKNKAYEDQLVENASQQRLVAFFKDYLVEAKNSNSALPTNIGIEESNAPEGGGLSALVAEYNTLLADRKRVALISSEKNPAMATYDANLASLYENIMVGIKSHERNLSLKQTEIEREVAKYDQRLQSAPTQERQFIGITRQQEIKAGLYLLLLQKREENALLVASTTNIARIFEETAASGVPLSPKTNQIYMIALIFGLAIPASILILIEMLKFKIEGSKDVEKITNVPVVGVIPFLKKMPNRKNSIVVEENKNDIMAEGFRHLRTNLLYMLTPEQKMILVTSTHTSEGKSYVSANLAISLALMGKRVVIVGLDLRKKGLNAILGTSSKQSSGISSYLSGHCSDLLSLVEEIQPNLHVLYGGEVPPNPTELLSRETLPAAFDILKANYDYVILDTAPVGVVTDTYQFSKYADLSLYVCRANVTNKSDFELINLVSRDNRLPNLCTTIVGVKASNSRYGGYGYGYGGYGYGGGYGQDASSKKKRR